MQQRWMSFKRYHLPKLAAHRCTAELQAEDNRFMLA